MAIDAEEKRKNDNPAPRLLLVLLRYFAGFWEKTTLAAAGRFEPHALGSWERGERAVPAYALERTADVASFPRYLIPPALRTLRSFWLAAKGKARAGRVLAQVSVMEVLPLAASAVDLILEPLAEDRTGKPSKPSPIDREEAESLWERLERRPWNHRWLLVENVAEFQTWALAERVAGESRAKAAADPREAAELAKLALRIAELAPGTLNEALLKSLEATVSRQSRS